MSAAALVEPFHWWDIAEVAVADAEIFGDDAWTPEYYWAQMAAGQLTQSCYFRTARSAQGALLGWIVMSRAGADADVMTIATMPTARGQGIGTQLLESGLQWAEQAGVQAVHLEVRSDNDPALRLYRQRGFCELGRRSGYYAHADAVLMRLLLSQ